MKRVLTSVIVSFIFLHLFAQENIIKSPAGAKINLFVRNVCQDFAQVVICDGDSSNQIHPTVGIVDCSSFTYKHIDSLLSFSSIKYFDLDEEGLWQWSSKIFSLGNQSLILSYQISYPIGWCDSVEVISMDTIHSDSISGINFIEGRLNYNRQTNLSNNFFSPYINPISIYLDFTPIAISAAKWKQECAVIGTNQINVMELVIIDRLTGAILRHTTLPSQVQNVHSIKYINNDVYIVSCPGDTVTNLLTYDVLNNVFSTQILYSGSGLNISSWSDYEYYFQPESDTSINNFAKHLFVYNFQNHSVLSNNINKKLKSLQCNSWAYLAAVEKILSTNVIYFYTSNSMQLFDSLTVGVNPKFYKGDFRCPTKVEEYDDSKVEWNVYPNPSSSDFNLIASGLICGRVYKVDIIDMTGAVKYENIIHAKMVVELPTENYTSGMYFIRIHTLKGMVTQKVVKF